MYGIYRIMYKNIRKVWLISENSIKSLRALGLGFLIPDI